MTQFARLLMRPLMNGLGGAGFALMIGLVSAWPAVAELRIDITQGKVEPLPIAITDFIGAVDGESQYGVDISRVIAANLERSGLFRPINKGAFIQTAMALQTLPRFGDWRVINAQAMVQGRVQLLGNGSRERPRSCFLKARACLWPASESRYQSRDAG